MAMSNAQLTARLRRVESMLTAVNGTLERTAGAVAINTGNYDESLDTIWMLLAAILVFFTHAGFSMLEVGHVRSKNWQNILTKNLLVISVGFLAWYLVGYPFAFGNLDPPNRFIGAKGFAMDGFMANEAGRVGLRVWFFQGAFCATEATIVSGAMAERTQLKGFAVYTLFMTAMIYPVVVHWGWSGAGLLNYTDDAGLAKSLVGPALKDFAGSGIVHLVGGVGALVGALAVGPRVGRYSVPPSEGFDSQTVPCIALGTFFLWFGWYGFNAGSTAEMHNIAAATTAGLIAVNTTLAPCVAGLVVFLVRATFEAPRKLDLCGFCNGILAGLVSITATCAFVRPWEALVIGCIGGTMFLGASKLVKLCKVDDVVDGFAVHGACGLWGVLAAGLFGRPADGMGGNGLLYGGDQLRTQAVAVLLIAVWVGAASALALVPMRLLGMLRLPEQHEVKGADAAEHAPAEAFNHDAGPVQSRDVESAGSEPQRAQAVAERRAISM